MRLFSLRSTAIALVALLGGCQTTITCATGYVYSGGMCVPGPGDGGVDAPTDAGPCGVCDTATPYCDETMSPPACVECLNAGHCTAPDLACVDGACEVCDGDEDCTNAGASTCDLTSYTCVPCTSPSDCGHDGLGGICDTSGGSGVCVECLVTDETACGGNSCDPGTLECTTTAIGSVRRCGACVADSECMNADDRCVEMDFMGAAHGSYCLKQADTGCAAPFTTPTASVGSTSGATAEIYCGIDQSSTTCEAVLDLQDDTSCTMDSDCGAVGLDDGLCRSVNFVANRCTYACATAADCPTGRACPSATYCGSP